MKKLILFILCIPVVLIIIVLINTFLFTSNQDKVPAVTPVKVEQDVVVGNLSQAIQHRTLSTQDSSKFNPEPFLKFNAFLEQTYPLMHQKLEREVVNGYSLLYKWAGSDESLKPVMFLAHIDVVPVEPGTQKDWKYDAFSGQIADGFVWGRGALDMKSTLMGLMEATESLIQTGFRPKRTIYFAFGHDEEIGGSEGAARIAALFKARGIRLAFTLDEGMAILNEALSPAKKQLAVIGLAEKGYVTLKISVETKGGHSSMPPNQTSLGILSKAVSQLEQNQMPASLSGAVGLLFDTIGPDLPFVQKALFANQWLFKGLIIGQLSKKNTTNAMIRTTTAPTIMTGGVKENVLPSKAHALVNFRILPGDTVSDVVTHAKNVIDDPNVQIT
ncbi:MAG: M20/M25/M40 family metallo-hydrolase, partial [Desulfobacterales bacterium]|nr:M20/M25/M40 family metallo-hydrolase [Desulfobacterales bacterium]